MRNRTRLERALSRAGSTLLGYGTGSNGQVYARARLAGGGIMNIPMAGRGGGSGSAGG